MRPALRAGTGGAATATIGSTAHAMRNTYRAAGETPNSIDCMMVIGLSDLLRRWR